MVKGNVRKPVLAADVERNTSLPKERELKLMNETKKVKKRIREIVVLLDERKTFRSGYSRNQRDKVKCFSCGKLRHIVRNCFIKRRKNNFLVKPEKEKTFEYEFLGKET